MTTGNAQSKATQLVAAVAEVPAMFAGLNAVMKAGPAPKSQARKEAARPLGQYVSILAGQHLSAGIDQLHTWHRLLTPVLTPMGRLEVFEPIAAHLTLIRGAIEGAVMCRWLVDPRVEAATHIQRGLALMIEDYRNQRAWEYDRGIAPDAFVAPGRTGAQRHQDFVTARRDAKIEDVEVPNFVDLCGLYAGLQSACHGRAWYRLLSANAHGYQWGSMAVVLEEVEGAPEIPGGRLRMTSANDEVAVTATGLAVRAAKIALGEYAAYEGRSGSGQ